MIDGIASTPRYLERANIIAGDFMTRDYYGDGKPCGIIPSLNKLICKYYELNLYVADKGWYTFPHEWKECDWTTTLKKYGINSTLISIDI